MIVEFRERGGTVLLNSHLLSEVERVCDRVGVIHGGRLLREGPVDELMGEGQELEDFFVELVQSAGGGAGYAPQWNEQWAAYQQQQQAGEQRNSRLRIRAGAHASAPPAAPAVAPLPPWEEHPPQTPATRPSSDTPTPPNRRRLLIPSLTGAPGRRHPLHAARLRQSPLSLVALRCLGGTGHRACSRRPVRPPRGSRHPGEGSSLRHRYRRPLPAISIIVVGLAVIRPDIDSGAAALVLTRPVSRAEYVAGRYLGSTLTLFVTLAIMGLGSFVVVLAVDM